jgi:aromatic ring hydroxylase
MFIETGDQYRQSLVGRNLEIYAGGERITDVPRILTSPGVNAIALLYDLAQNPELDALMPHVRMSREPRSIATATFPEQR